MVISLLSFNISASAENSVNNNLEKINNSSFNSNENNNTKQDQKQNFNNNDITKAFETVVVDSLEYILNAPGEFGFTYEQISTASIGDSFKFVDINNDGTKQNKKNILYYPIYSEDTLIAILTLIKCDGEVSCNIGKDFSSKLMDSLSSSLNHRVALFANTKGLFATDEENNIYTLCDLTELQDISISSLQPDIKGISYDDITEQINIVTQNKLDMLLVKDLFELGVDNSNNMVISAVTGTTNLVNYPIVNQRVDGNQVGICWAATIASMARYEMPSIYGSLTAKQVCDATSQPYVGANWDVIMSTFNMYFTTPYLPTKINTVLDNSAIMTVIDNNDPAYMSSVLVGGTSAHATALCGYYYGNPTMTIRIMDPAYECFKTSRYSGTTGWIYAFGNSQYKWDKTVRLLYR